MPNVCRELRANYKLIVLLLAKYFRTLNYLKISLQNFYSKNYNGCARWDYFSAFGAF